MSTQPDTTGWLQKWVCPHCGDLERIDGLEPGESPGLHSCDVAMMVLACTCGKPSGAEHYCTTLNRLRFPVPAGPNDG